MAPTTTGRGRSASDEGGSGVAGLVYRATGADAVPSVRTVVDRAQLTIPTDGITTVHVHAVDRRGNAGPEASTTVKLDQTPLAIDVTSPPTANRYLAVTEVGVALCFGATDPLSGLKYLDARLFDWEGGGGIVRDGHVIDAPGIYRLDILARRERERLRNDARGRRSPARSLSSIFTSVRVTDRSPAIPRPTTRSRRRCRSSPHDRPASSKVQALGQGRG